MYTNFKFFSLIIFIILFSGCANQNIKEKTQISKKKQKIYKYCKKHENIMIYAANYIKNEFEKGYFEKEDIKGGKAQLFLIEKKSPTIFAQNINAASSSYIKQYNIAKTHGCDIRRFKEFPLETIKKTIKDFEERKK